MGIMEKKMDSASSSPPPGPSVGRHGACSGSCCASHVRWKAANEQRKIVRRILRSGTAYTNVLKLLYHIHDFRTLNLLFLRLGANVKLLHSRLQGAQLQQLLQ